MRVTIPASGGLDSTTLLWEALTTTAHDIVAVHYDEGLAAGALPGPGGARGGSVRRDRGLAPPRGAGIRDPPRADRGHLGERRTPAGRRAPGAAWLRRDGAGRLALRDLRHPRPLRGRDRRRRSLGRAQHLEPPPRHGLARHRTRRVPRPGGAGAGAALPVASRSGTASGPAARGSATCAASRTNFMRSRPGATATAGRATAAPASPAAPVPSTTAGAAASTTRPSPRSRNGSRSWPGSAATSTPPTPTPTATASSTRSSKTNIAGASGSRRRGRAASEGPRAAVYDWPIDVGIHGRNFAYFRRSPMKHFVLCALVAILVSGCGSNEGPVRSRWKQRGRDGDRGRKPR